MSAPHADTSLMYEPKVWIAVAFAIFMLGFFKWALPFIVRGLDKRSADIRNELDEAIRLREEAQATLAEYKQKQKEMMAEAEAMIAHAKQETNAMKANAEAALKASIERRTKMAHDKIARAEADAVARVQSDMANIAVLAAQELIEDHLQESGDEALIEHASADLKQIVH